MLIGNLLVSKSVDIAGISIYLAPDYSYLRDWAGFASAA